jgi:hypothetical protein
MTTDWNQSYAALTDYIAAHPDIRISTNEVSIPKELRDEFYRHFDKTRHAIVDAYASSLPVDMDSLSRNYVKAEQEITEMLGLEGIVIPVDLKTFLYNPKEGLARVLYNGLFDLLQGKAEHAAFQQQVGNDIKSTAVELYRLGYEQWAGLALITLLEPDEAFLVDLDEDYTPFLTELKSIAFGRQAHHPTLRIPEFVVHSKKLNRDVAVKMALAREIETYYVPFAPPVRPKKRTGDTSFALDFRVLLLYFLEDRKSIPIITDLGGRSTIASPDLVIEYVTESELSDINVLNQIQRRIQTVNPRLGTCLFVMDPSKEMPPGQLAEGIYPAAIGFDASAMNAAIDRLQLG